MEASAAMGSASTRDAFSDRLKGWQTRMERALAARLPSAETEPKRLHAAMRYSVLGSGKRVRPALLFATAATLGLGEDEVEGAACAVELIHAYSLVHDDLPAMDDDDLRRGRPTCHRAFDEATALLVGDSLQPLAFELLARDAALPESPSIRVQLVGLLAEASGSSGMAGGQAIDLARQGPQTGCRRPRVDARAQDRCADPCQRVDGRSVRAGAARRSPTRRSRPMRRRWDWRFRFRTTYSMRPATWRHSAKPSVPIGARVVRPTLPSWASASPASASAYCTSARAMRSPSFGRAAEPLHEISDWLLMRRN